MGTSAKVRVVTGPARSGKTARLLTLYRAAVVDGPIGSALWLSPNYRAARLVRQQILADGMAGCFSPNCLTFDQFASHVLNASDLEGRPISLVVQRRILRRLVDEAVAHGRLPHFAPIAATNGFLDLLVNLLQELKRLEIWPDEFRKACGRRASQKDRELSDLYQRYQQLLTDHKLYDAQGRFWLAREQLRAGLRRPFAALERVFVDGFTDFTRTEHEMLEILAGSVESLAISLPLDDGDERGELFAKPLATLEQLRRRHGQVQIEALPRRKSACAAIDHVERWLFVNPRRLEPAADGTGIEIVAAAGVTQEIESLARRIKRLLVEGDAGRDVRPSDILVVFRSLADTADRVRQTFAEFGIPHVIAAERTLHQAPIMSALVGWLRLKLDNWPFRQLLSALAHNYFRPTWLAWKDGAAIVAAERIVRHLQVPAGYEQLAAGVARAAKYAARDEIDADEPAVDDRLLRARGDALLAGPLLDHMNRALTALPKQATLAEWAAVIDVLASDVGLNEAANSGPAASAALDLAAWQTMIEALTDAAALADWTGEKAEQLTLGDFVSQLEELLRCERLPLDADETGRVRVLSAERARNLSVPYVFVAGLSERTFPSHQREDCLASEVERASLAAAGLPLVGPTERGRHEMLLFYEVVTRATRRLVLSYPALDAAAQPLSPSPYLAELERACGEGRITRHVELDLRSVPPDDNVLCGRDFRVRAVAQTLDGNAALVAELRGHVGTRAVADPLIAGLRVTHARKDLAFGQFDGMFHSPAARQILAGRYGPDHCWSPSELEQYARCPHRFFLDRVLRLAPLEEPTLDVNSSKRGRMLHTLLAALHRRLARPDGGGLSPTEWSDSELLAEVESLLSELRARLRGDEPLANGLLEIDARQVAEWLADYRRQHDAYDQASNRWPEPLRPAHFEVAFGTSRRDEAQSGAGDAADTLSTAEPFELDCGGQRVRFSGRIDRIDLGAVAGRPVFAIVDYKSTASDRTSKRAVFEGYALQLPIYALAAARLLESSQAAPWGAGYWHVSDGGYHAAIEFHQTADGVLLMTDDWADLEQQLRARVASLVDSVRRGEFPMHSADDKCTGWCEFRTVCRVNQARSLGKTWEPRTEPAS